MPLIDFIFSNDRHHVAMFLPVIQRLITDSSYRCRAISLCEFRGIPSPADRFMMERVEFIRILPFRFRSSSTGGGQTGNTRAHSIRQWMRRLSWHLLLRRRFVKCYHTKPDLVVLPNDAAFPYDRIVRLLKQRAIPFMLMQEGIRFPLPNPNGEPVYGAGGAVAIAAWGETSAEYFSCAGAPSERIVCVGNPRFDVIPERDWRAEADPLKKRLGLGNRNLLFLSNPIDDQGFCTTREKMQLVREFIAGIAPLFDDPDFRLLIKLHGRESTPDFVAVARAFPFADRIAVLNASPLYPLFTLAQAAIVLASSVGLEALMFGLALGVLEIPRAGFVSDYVSGGGAQALTWNRPLDVQVRELFDAGQRASAVAYLARNLAVRRDSTGEIVKLIRRLGLLNGSME